MQQTAKHASACRAACRHDDYASGDEELAEYEENLIKGHSNIGINFQYYMRHLSIYYIKLLY